MPINPKKSREARAEIGPDSRTASVAAVSIHSRPHDSPTEVIAIRAASHPASCRDEDVGQPSIADAKFFIFGIVAALIFLLLSNGGVR